MAHRFENTTTSSIPQANHPMTRQYPDRAKLNEMSESFMTCCVLGAAAELDLFSLLAGQAATAEEVARQIRGDRRCTEVLLDAAVALGVVEKSEGRYRTPEPLVSLLTEGPEETLLPMVRHRMSILRGWSQLAWTARAGIPCPRQASIRGPAGDREAFVAAMHSASGPIADEVIAGWGPPRFRHLLDVGGASGTWTLALLRAVPGSRATLFDLPDAVGQARERIGGTEFRDRVTLVAGDFYRDELPPGADLAWVSAIVHQHSRDDNRRLFRKVHAALEPGGTIAIRDVVMAPDHTEPTFGALFAVNMIVNTETGGTFSLEELAEDLEAAGLANPQLAVKTSDMSSIVTATKP
ncbi:MAG: methyltransferase [Thermoguttaceae bacterium]